MTRSPGRWALVAGAAVLFGPPALLAILFANGKPADFPPAALLLLVGLCAAGLAAAALVPLSRAERLLPLFVLALVVLWPEVALRAAGFRYDPSRMVIEFGLTQPEHMAGLVRDPYLFWKLEPGRGEVNSLGFVGPEPAVPKPPGVWRILFFGDSCTWLGFPASVPKPLSRRLAARSPADDHVVEAVNLGVPGYSTFQGARLATLVARRFQPDLGVVVYGWNDHWLARGTTDSDKGRGRGRLGSALSAVISRSRLLQYALKTSGSGDPKFLDVPRVSPEEYRTNLAAIGEAIEEAGGRVLLVTAPSPHLNVGVPRNLVESKLATSPQHVVEWHRRYNAIVRGVAAAKHWPLLDLEARSDTLSDPSLIFMPDGIHFTTPRGNSWVADAVAEAIARDVLPPSGSEPVRSDSAGAAVSGS